MSFETWAIENGLNPYLRLDGVEAKPQASKRHNATVPDSDLNEQQQSVLRWIADGCPDGVMEGYGYRISASALRARGLATINGRGLKWRAELTDAGRRSLQEPDQPRAEPVIQPAVSSPPVSNDEHLARGARAGQSGRTQGLLAYDPVVAVAFLEAHETYAVYWGTNRRRRLINGQPVNQVVAGWIRGWRERTDGIPLDRLVQVIEPLGFTVQDLGAWARGEVLDPHVEQPQPGDPVVLPPVLPGVRRLAYTQAEAAQSLGVSESWFRRAILPEMAVVRRGRRTIIPVSEVRRWLAENAEPL